MGVYRKNDKYHRHVFSNLKTQKEPMNTKIQYLIVHTYSFGPVIIDKEKEKEGEEWDAKDKRMA